MQICEETSLLPVLCKCKACKKGRLCLTRLSEVLTSLQLGTGYNRALEDRNIRLDKAKREQEIKMRQYEAMMAQNKIGRPGSGGFTGSALSQGGIAKPPASQGALSEHNP